MTPELYKHAINFLESTGLLTNQDPIKFEPLTGGVSSDIFRFELNGNYFCLKCALPKLRVKADWHADIDRSYYESEWLRYAVTILPDSAVKFIAHNRESGLILMEYLPSENYKVWKTELSKGITNTEFAKEVGTNLATLHSHSAFKKEIASTFQSMAIFHQLRIEPYLLATSEKQEDEVICHQLHSLAESLQHTRKVLIHGDISPKNILCGPNGPVFIDAECACFGDPAFDLAFCLNHLLLKSVWKPDYSDNFINMFLDLKTSYLGAVDWEDCDDLESRAVQLLSALMLARVDGKSPVEYINSVEHIQFIRSFCRGQMYSDIRELDVFANEFKSSHQKLLEAYLQ